MNLEKRQILFDLTEDAALPILFEVLEELTRSIELEVIRYDLNARGPEGLVHIKCEAQGARRLKCGLEAHLKILRQKSLQ